MLNQNCLMRKAIRPTTKALATLLCFAIFSMPSPTSWADESRLVYEVEIDANVEAVWKAFTTEEGLKSWMAPIVEIDLTVGGKMRSSYQQDGKLGDASTIENTILSFDPKRMLSLKATKFPENFSFEAAAKQNWSIFYFSELSPTRTKVTIVGLGYDESVQSQQLRSFFKGANERSMNQLKRVLTANADTKP